MQIPDRTLTVDEELYYRRRERALEKAEQELHEQWKEQAELPSYWFGRLLRVALGSLALIAVVWLSVFFEPRINYWLGAFLWIVLGIALVGIAGLMARGFIVGNRQNQALADLRENFVYTESSEKRP